MSFTKMFARGAVVAVVASSAALGIPSTASAAPTGCQAGGGFTYATAYCSGGTGAYQAYAVCKQSFWPFYSRFVESTWKRAKSGETAWVWCPLGYDVRSRGVGIRN